MCGLVGFYRGNSGQLNSKYTAFKDAISDLVAVDSLRGVDSTGIVLAKENNKYVTAKDTCPGWAFVKSSKWADATSVLDRSYAFLGHNRAATMGGKTYEAAHPHINKHIMLMHNGTLRGSWDSVLPKASPNNVDSARIASALASWGIEKTCSRLDGAYALTWIDTKDKTLNIIKNNERPLTIAYSKELDTLFWASELAFIQFALSRNKLGFDWYCPLPNMRMFTFGLNATLDMPTDVKKVDDYLESISYEVEEYVFTGANAYAGGGYYSGGYYKGSDDSSKAIAKQSTPKVTNLAGESKNTFLNRYKVKEGDFIKIRIEAFQEYVTVGKDGQPAPAGKGLLLSYFKAYNGEDVPCVIFDFPESRYENRQGATMTSALAKITGASWFNNEYKGSQKYVITLDKSHMSHVEYQAPYSGKVTGKKEYQGFQGELLTYTEWSSLIQDGCGLCHVPLHNYKPEEIQWPWEDIPVCPNCGNDDAVIIYDASTKTISEAS